MTFLVDKTYQGSQRIETTWQAVITTLKPHYAAAALIKTNIIIIVKHNYVLQRAIA